MRTAPALMRRQSSAAQPPSLSRAASLDCIPLRNPEAVCEPLAEGLRLNYQIRAKPWLQWLTRRLLSSGSTVVHRKLELDYLGRSVWELIDGHRSVREIAGIFRAQHQLDPREAELAVSAFLRELGKRGLVALKGE